MEELKELPIFELSTREISIVDDRKRGGVVEKGGRGVCLSNIRSNVVLTRPGLTPRRGSNDVRGDRSAIRFANGNCHDDGV